MELEKHQYINLFIMKEIKQAEQCIYYDWDKGKKIQEHK